MAATSLVAGSTAEDKWRSLLAGLSRFVGRTLTVNAEVYRSASATNFRNRERAELLGSYDRMYDVGLPGTSGIDGGIVTVSPGKGGLGTFAPHSTVRGNSVKGQLAARYLSSRLGLDLFDSEPEA